ncbi:MAG TPA: lysophospholipid acyltransferase family protein [Thermoanaerobaculia bacterium]|nr:lysophospholipid acyltransferase family protein [Thermoanaerobaculia bacterium]
MQFISLLGMIFIRTLHATLRVRHVDSENITGVKQYVLAFWHAHLLLMLHSRHGRPITVMSSRSRDGQYIAGVFKWYGVSVVRGSTSRGGSAALRGLIRNARTGSNIVFTPDGPRGPARKAKDGVIFAARATGLPIIPVAFAAKKKRRLASWDRMVVPYPFTRAIYLYGPPIHIARDADAEKERERLETIMNALADRADRDFEELWKKQ